MMLGSAGSEHPPAGYLSVKLFSKNSNQSDHNPPNVTDGWTDDFPPKAIPYSVYSRGQKFRDDIVFSHKLMLQIIQRFEQYYVTNYTFRNKVCLCELELSNIW